MTDGVDAPLETGWEPDTPRLDTLTRAAILAHADAFAHTARSMGGRVRQDGRLSLADSGSATFFLNTAVLLAPALAADFDATLQEVEAFFGRGTGGGVLLFSPFPTPDPGRPGWELVGHPPLMVRPPGPLTPPRPADLRIDEASDDELLSAFEAVLIEGFPFEGLGPAPRPGCLFDGRVLEDATYRCFVGSVGGRAATAAAAYLDPHVLVVAWVATLEQFRGRGYGAAITARAVQEAPTLPAILFASDPGRSVYERLGFLPILRCTAWVWDERRPAA